MNPLEMMPNLPNRQLVVNKDFIIFKISYNNTLPKLIEHKKHIKTTSAKML